MVFWVFCTLHKKDYLYSIIYIFNDFAIKIAKAKKRVRVNNNNCKYEITFNDNFCNGILKVGNVIIGTVKI